MELQDITELFINCGFKVFQDCIANAGSIKAVVVPDKASMTRKEIDKITELAKKNGAKGLVTLKYLNGEVSGPIVKFLSEDEIHALIERLTLKENDLVLIVSDKWRITCEVLGALRNHFGSLLGLKKKDEFSYLWVTDFPMFEYSEEDGRWYAMHHPFTRPRDEDMQYLSLIHISFTEDGVHVNSAFLNGMGKQEAIDTMIKWLEEHHCGCAKTTYKLRDWLFSRQRYWGEPIPIIHMEDGTTRTVDIDELPLELPETKIFKPNANGESPLAHCEDWLNVEIDGVKGKRETNTMPQWAGSCWYYLRYICLLYTSRCV